MTAFRIVRVPDANNPTIGDLYVDAAGNFELVDELEAIAQRIFVRFNFFLGEWVHDLRQGMPYREKLFEKGTTEADVRRILLRVLSDTPGVREVIFLRPTLDRAARAMDVEFEVRAVNGGRVSSAEYGPFLVALEESIAA